MVAAVVEQGKAPSGGLQAALTFPPEVLEALAEAVAQRLLAAQAPATPWLDVPRAAAYLVCSKQRVYDLVSEGVLHPARDGRRLLFDRQALDEYLRATT